MVCEITFPMPVDLVVESLRQPPLKAASRTNENLWPPYDEAAGRSLQWKAQAPPALAFTVEVPHEAGEFLVFHGGERGGATI